MDCLALVIDNHGITKSCVAKWYDEAKKLAPSRKIQLDQERAAAAKAEAERIMQENKITRESILTKYWRMARADVRKMYHPDGRLKKIHELDDATAAGIMQIEVYSGDDPARQGDILSFKFANPKHVLDSICKVEGYSIAPRPDIPENEDEIDLETLVVRYS